MVKVFCFSHLEKFGLSKKEISRVKNECNRAKKNKDSWVSVTLNKVSLYEYELGEVEFFDSYEDKPSDVIALPTINFMKD